jgi:hypothetical protein
MVAKKLPRRRSGGAEIFKKQAEIGLHFTMHIILN